MGMRATYILFVIQNLHRSLGLLSVLGLTGNPLHAKGEGEL